jgi:hypothetical protein
MKTSEIKRKCFNCNFASSAFRIAGITHHQCNHPKHESGFKSGELSPWDTLQEFYQTCESHEFKLRNKMKISEIKSDEVRNEAVRLCVERKPSERNKEIALEFDLYSAFRWDLTPQGGIFWNKLLTKKTPNTPDLKLPEKNPSE